MSPLQMRLLPGRAALAALAALAFLLPGRLVPADEHDSRVLNGFALRDARVPVDEIVRGGPARDGIPALDSPPALAAASAPWHDDEMVIGVAEDGAARAYPIAILSWHELINDRLGERDILVSYCPLCGTGMVFDRKVGGTVRTFGVSGLLYRSDLLLYDRESESLWSQIESLALTGPASGMRLSLRRSKLTSWARWKALHPGTTVVGLETGHRRDYSRSPYGAYALSDRLLFPAPLDPRYHPKMPTLGVRTTDPDGAARAYPAAELVKAGGSVEEVFAGRAIAVSYDADAQIFDVEAPHDLEVIEAYWFAWSAFQPDTTVFTVDPAASNGEK